MKAISVKPLASPIVLLALASTLIFSIFGLQQTAVAQPDPTSQFRNNAEHTGEVVESFLHLSNISDLAIQWKGITTSSIVASATVVIQPIDHGHHHVAYVTSYDGFLYAFNADNCYFGHESGGGQECPVLWQFAIGNNAFSSPAVATELIGGTPTSVAYVAGGGGDLYAINAVTGTQIWTTHIGNPGPYTSPVVANGVVYILSTGLGELLAFDAVAGGPSLWAAVTKGWASPTIAKGIVYVGDDSGTIRAFSANGCASPPCQPLGSISGFGAFNSTAAVSNGRVFVGSDDYNLYAFEASDASCSSICGPLWSANLGSPVLSSPAVANGVVYVIGGSFTSNGKLYAFDANCSGPACGTPLWTGDIHGYYSASSPVVANGVVYVDSDDGYTYAFDVTGCGGSTTCSPLVRVNTHNGASVESSPAVVDGVVYVGSTDGTLYILGTCGYVCRYDNQSLY